MKTMRRASLSIISCFAVYVQLNNIMMVKHPVPYHGKGTDLDGIE